MKSIEPTELMGKALYALMTSAVVPRPIAWVSTLNPNGTVNMAPFSYFNLVSSQPPILMISVGEREGVPKDTALNILESKEFVVHLVTESTLEAMNLTAKDLSREDSEVALASLTPVVSTHLKTPGIAESPIRLECVYDQHITYPRSQVIFGRIVQMHFDEGVLTDGVVDAEKLQPIGRLGKQQYTTLGRILTLKRP
jgi:flavin reductase (DIM6/NTAB) family NADH-FMN oxidoreductase RutF